MPKAQKIVCREVDSVKRAKKYSVDNTLLFQDFSKEILLKNNTIKQNNILLINVSPKYFTKTNLNKIKKYIKASKDVISAHPVESRKIFFPADINFDKEFYPQLRKEIPNLEIYDRTKHSLSETIELFSSCTGGV